MPAHIEDYAMIGNRETAALVCRNGSIDWLCMPRFDSASCFSALLGDPSHGRWLFAPVSGEIRSHRRYRGDSLILETIHETATGAVMVTDFMTRGEHHSYVMRQIVGLSGSVSMHGELVVRFDYGAVLPWASRLEDGRMQYVAGPDRLVLESPIEFENRDMRSSVQFDIKAGEKLNFALGWSRSYGALPAPRDVDAEILRHEDGWRRWTSRFTGAGGYSEPVLRSLITLHALAHFETGGIVAAVTTSLPESIGQSRNWDYRFCWLRDATLTLYALMESNYIDEAIGWRRWLARAIAGSPSDLQIMYGVAGERRIEEFEAPWLPGYEGSKPVRIGNAASHQIQLDIYGEVMDALYLASRKGLPPDNDIWQVQCEMLRHLAGIWAQPDEGIWEVRGGKQHFTHSKMMAWVAFDRGVRSITEFGYHGPMDEWRQIAQEIHAEICQNHFDPELNSFVQYRGSKAVDSALLLMALTGFLAPDDPRVVGTVTAIENELLQDGLVMRYRTEKGVDGLPPGEGVFLACSFWLADNYVLQGRLDDARRLFEKLLALRNDVGLLSEEYDTARRRQVGNFPQAFSHIALINTAYNLVRAAGPASQRAEAANSSQQKS